MIYSTGLYALNILNSDFETRGDWHRIDKFSKPSQD